MTTSRRWILLALAVTPAILMGSLILRYGVNVPYWDEWDNTVYVHQRYVGGQLTIGDFFFQANEHRPAVVRAICLVCEIATHGNRRVEMLVSLACVCVTSLCLYALARKTIPQHALAFIAIANWLLFSPVQYENWTWGIQMLMFLPITLFSAAMLVAYSKWPYALKVGVGLALWILSTLCFISGFFFWPLLLMIHLIVAPSGRARQNAAIVSVLVLATTAGMYFSGMGPTPAPARPDLVMEHPADAMRFFGAFFASPFRIAGMTWGILWWLGAAILVLSLVPAVKLLRRRQNFAAYAPGIAFLGFALISGAGATVSRLQFGLPQSQMSRYTTLSLLLPLGALVLWFVEFPRLHVSARRAIMMGGAALLILHLSASYQRIGAMETDSAHREAGRAALARINQDPENTDLAWLYPDRRRLRMLANQYSASGALLE
jgi:hypothetical protein